MKPVSIFYHQTRQGKNNKMINRYCRSIIGIYILSCSLVIMVPHSLAGYTVSGKIKNNPIPQIRLLEVYGDQYRVVNKSDISEQGEFIFNLDNNNPPGMYRVDLGKGKIVNLIYNNEDIVFDIDYDPVRKDIKNVAFSKSKENRLLRDFINREKRINRKKRILHKSLNSYSKDDSFYKILKDQLDKIIIEKSDFYNDLLNKSSGTFAGKMIRWFKDDHVDCKENAGCTDAYFTKIHFSDPEILHTDILTRKIKSYLQNKEEKSDSGENPEEESKKFINKIMRLADENNEIKSYVIEFLLRRYERKGFEKIYIYIADTYASKIFNKETDNSFMDMIAAKSDAFKRLSIGKTAPDFILPGTDPEIKISEKDFKYGLVLFWRSDCPHCENLILDLESLYSNNSFKDLEIFPIPLDDSKEELGLFLKKNPLPWNVYYDFNEGYIDPKIQEDYFILSVPTMYLLDSERRIMAKTSDIDELNATIEGMVN